VPWSVSRGLIWRVVLTVASFLLVAVAIELFIFYALDVKPPGFRPDRFLQFDSLHGGSHKPGARGWWYRYTDGTKFMVSINSYGFSDVE
jgi:hypothetical protein